MRWAWLSLVFIVLLAGCTNPNNVQQSSGVLISNELSSEQMQPGGAVQLRTSINNFFDNELRNVKVKLIRSFGQLDISPSAPQSIGVIQANPNATARTSWTMVVKRTASPGTVFSNKVRMCFDYNQTAWHEVALVNSFRKDFEVNGGSDTGPLMITFAGLDNPFIYNDDIHSQIPISISIRNNYNGYVGTIDSSQDIIQNITRIDVRIYDYDGGPNCSPISECLDDDGYFTSLNYGTNFEIMREFTNPACSDDSSVGCFVCNNSLWDEDKELFDCYADNLSIFGNEVFIGTKLNVTDLKSEELVETIEVTASYTYCVESSEFNITVFNPGAR